MHDWCTKDWVQCLFIHSSLRETVCVCRVFGTVSYYVQKLFAEYQGVRYIDTAVSSSDGDPHDHGIAASASCQNQDCTRVAFKVRQTCLWDVSVILIPDMLLP